jgi:hypothetical protein
VRRIGISALAGFILLFTSAEMGARPASPDQSAPPTLKVDGAQFRDQAGKLYIPRWVSGLTLLVRTPTQQASFLDWAAKTGFNGVRVFAGALTWAEQTPEGARKALPGLLERAAARGLAVEVTALTDTATGYDAKAHLQHIVGIIAGRPGVVLELANEVGHPSQAKDLTAAGLRAWGKEIATPRGVVWAVGAAGSDTLTKGAYPAHGGTYNTVHLDRGGAMWAQIARVRSLHSIAEAHRVPVINNEAMGADEKPGRETGRQRWNDPAAFFALGVLDRAFGLGGVHHSQAGLMAELPGPVQQRCADAYVAGHRAVESVLDGTARFVDAGKAGSPVASINGKRVAAAYSFVSGERAVVVLVGADGEAAFKWASGWRQVRVAATMRGKDGRRVDVIHAAAVSSSIE